MVTPPRNPHPRDRHTDPVPPTGKPAVLFDGVEIGRKPPVLRRSTVKVACAIWLGLVIYGTLGPLGYRRV